MSGNANDNGTRRKVGCPFDAGRFVRTHQQVHETAW